MAEFGASATEAPQVQNFITPKEGVVEAASGVALAGDLFGQVRAIRGNQKEKRVLNLPEVVFVQILCKPFKLIPDCERS